MDAIIIDDLSENSEVIDLDGDGDDDIVEITNIHNFHKSGRYDDIMKDNKLMGEFIDRCLELENSNGMLRVINRSLIPVFERTSKNFCVSAMYKKIMTKALINLEKYPCLKFSHVKQLCKDLKYRCRYKKGSCKKPSALNLLHTVKSNYRKRKQINSNSVTTKKQKINENSTEIILSDDSDGFEPIINLEEYTKDVSVVKDKDVKYIEIDIEGTSVNGDDVLNKKPENANVTCAVKNSESVEIIEVDNEQAKSNVDLANRNIVIEIPEVTISDEELVEVTDNVEASSEPERNETDHNVKESVEPVVTDIDKLLVPHKVEAFAGYNEQMLMDRIKKIEDDITMYKELVAKLEEEEVLDDSIYSPYIKCEEYKAKIVTLYRQLCQLTGEKPIKRREVRFTAASERLELPMRRLEEFINSNIGSDGLPHFPDFADVVQCVNEANRIGGLGWNRNQVMTEARALFTFCGKALQNSRQRREWRDLLSLVKRDMIEDPADTDPELMARLQANRRQAVTREEEIFARYSGTSYPEQIMEESNHSNDETTSNENQTHTNNTINRVRIVPISVPSNNSNYATHKVTKIVNKQNQVVEVVVSGKQMGNNDRTEVVTENQTSSSTREIITVPLNDTEEKVSESCSTFSPCSISLMHVLETGSNITGMHPKDISSQNIVPCSITDVSRKQQELGKQNYKDVPVVAIDINNASGLDRDASNINDINSSLPGHVETPEVIEPLLILKTELNDTETNNNTDVTNNTNQSADELVDINQVSDEIMAHLLNARVVLPKMLIKYETTNSVTDTNSTVINTMNNDGHEYEEEVETTQNSELGIKIKEEPCVDIQKELDELGDDFTITVFDIQDPFLVVEISSDSSSEDEADFEDNAHDL